MVTKENHGANTETKIHCLNSRLCKIERSIQLELSISIEMSSKLLIVFLGVRNPNQHHH